MRVTLIQHLPDFLSLGFSQAIVQNIASDQNYTLLEKQLRKESEHTVRLGIGPASLKVLQVCT